MKVDIVSIIGIVVISTAPVAGAWWQKKVYLRQQEEKFWAALRWSLKPLSLDNWAKKREETDKTRG